MKRFALLLIVAAVATTQPRRHDPAQDFSVTVNREGADFVLHFLSENRAVQGFVADVYLNTGGMEPAAHSVAHCFAVDGACTYTVTGPAVSVLVSGHEVVTYGDSYVTGYPALGN